MADSAPDTAPAGEPALEILPDSGAVGRAAAGRIATALEAAVAARGRADWATTGGSSPIGIYRELGGAPFRDGVPWRDVHVWWGDDRFVPRDHPLSNVLALDEVLLRGAAFAGQSGDGESGIDIDAGGDRGVRIPPENLHVIPMNAAIGLDHDPAWAAAAYERELREAPLAHSAAGFPILDVVILGVGPDGHLLSVFPGSRIFDAGAWVAGVPAPTHIEPHVARVSLNPEFVAAARLVLVIATGVEKAAILGAALGPERDPRRLPVQHARRSNAVWLLDEAAAAHIPR